jgi:hypothetical protein
VLAALCQGNRNTLEDYKRSNVTVQRQGTGWQVSGAFDLMEAHFGHDEADLSRLFAIYLEEDRQLARAFLQGYLSQTTPSPGFAKRFPVYMLLDHAIVWGLGSVFQAGGMDSGRFVMGQAGLSPLKVCSDRSFRTGRAPRHKNRCECACLRVQKVIESGMEALSICARYWREDKEVTYEN